jgi:short-subunit dehydrogenase
MKLSSKDIAYFKRFAVIIVTGGSSGIGCSIIKAILKLGPDLTVCNLSRSKPEIFLGQNGVHLPVDLSQAGALAETADALTDIVESAPAGELLLINNSGFGDYGQTPQLDARKQLQMIDLNIRAVVDLTARLLPTLLDRGGTVATIASTAAFQPTPFLATYGATKAFVRNWSLALHEDLRGTGVRALAICPGPTQSNFFKAAGFTHPPVGQSSKGGLDMTADEVALHTLLAIAREKTLVVTGWKNRVIAFFGSKLPINMVTRVGAIILRKMRLEQHKS